MKTIFDESFAPYGKVIEGYDFTELLNALEANTEKPDDKVIYEPSDAVLESLSVFNSLQDGLFGGLPIQIGYCNGTNTKLNCFEYHRGSEALVAADELVLIVAKQQDIKNGKISTDLAETFVVPKSTGVLCYETTLHYAPAKPDGSFRSIIVLPRLTNTDKPAFNPQNAEDGWLLARNKWLLAHPDSPEAKNGAYVGLTGKNIDIAQ